MKFHFATYTKAARGYVGAGPRYSVLAARGRGAARRGAREASGFGVRICEAMSPSRVSFLTAAPPSTKLRRMEPRHFLSRANVATKVLPGSSMTAAPTLIFA